MISLLIKSVIVASFFVQGGGNQLKKLQRNHRSLQTSNLPYIANLTNIIYTNEILDNILIPRVVGTPNHEKVFNYIKNELNKLDWNVEIDAFEQKTPIFGKLKFKNIIATLNPNAERYLVLACHYDSKYFEDIFFVGAIDSAVPCAMLLNLANVMKNDLRSLKDNINLNLKLIFFDGEEAFLNWGPNDSIYGAKHLAKVYDNNRHQLRNGDVISGLEKIDILVLLDLIGHEDTRFHNYFENTKHWYLKLAEIEDKLNNLNLLKKPKNKRYFVKRQSFGLIEDDHIPFLRRDVPVLHLISNPFPEEWHTEKDNRAILDMATIEDINMILRVFVVEYLNIYLQGHKEAHLLHKEL